MSSVEAESVVKNKLMEILEEELSVLKLREIKCDDEIECLNDSLPIGKDDDAVDKNDDFSSSDDKTADKLKVKDENENEGTYSSEDDANFTNGKISEGNTLRPVMHQQHQVEELAKKGESFYPDEKKMLQSTYKDRKARGIFDMESFVPPSEDLCEKILKRIEFYFEDYNLFKNSFLLSHINRNKNGYVHLKTVANLRKIRPLTKDLRVVIFSLKKSKVLELNPECTKIRRVQPVPNIEDTNFGKTVMVFNLPNQNLTVDYLEDLFSKFGNVVSVGIFEVESSDCDAYHRRCLTFHRQIASKEYGIVQFEKYDEAVKALKDEDSHLPKENEINVVPLLPQIFQKERRHLKFLDSFTRNAYPRRNKRRFKTRRDPRVAQNGMPASNGGAVRHGKNGGYHNENMARYPTGYMGGYQYPPRGNFRYPYNNGPFVPPNMNKYSDGQSFGVYGGRKNSKWNESRQLKTNNSFNVDRFYPNMYRAN